MWEYFDGHIFSDVVRIVGEWELQVKNNQSRIQVFEDRDGQFTYRISSPKRAPVKIRRKRFSTMEHALEHAVRELKEQFG